MKRKSTLGVQSETPPGFADCSQGESRNKSKTSRASRGGTSRLHHAGGGRRPEGHGKFCAEKGMAMRSLSQRQKRERAEHERKHEELLAEWGVSEQDLRRWRRHALAARRLKRNDPLLLKRYGREAAVEDLGNEEFCCDLAGKFALKSANRTGDAIGEVRDRYDRVVMELLAARYKNLTGNAIR